MAIAISSKLKHLNRGFCCSLLGITSLLFLLALESNGERRKEEIRWNGDFRFLKFESVFDPGAREGDSVVTLESPKLELSSSVLLESPSDMSKTLFGEGLSLLVSESSCVASSIWSFLLVSAIFLQIRI